MTGGEPMAPDVSATVSWARAVRIEFGLLGRARRRFLLGALALLLAGAIYAGVQAVIGDWNKPPHDLGGVFMATLLFTVLSRVKPGAMRRRTRATGSGPSRSPRAIVSLRGSWPVSAGSPWPH